MKSFEQWYVDNIEEIKKVIQKPLTEEEVEAVELILKVLPCPVCGNNIQVQKINSKAFIKCSCNKLTIHKSFSDKKTERIAEVKVARTWNRYAIKTN